MSEIKITAERAEEIYMAMIEKAKKGLAIKPCPCCGNSNLHIGPMSAMSMGIRCRAYNDKGKIDGCGLELYVSYPEYWNSKTNIDMALLRRAIKKWNRRVDFKKVERHKVINAAMEKLSSVRR